jgi:MFS transporter, MFS domain-containing protein family, molybdate-anion transporter
LAIFLTVICLGFVLSWNENYGKQDTVEDTAFSLAWHEITSKTPVMLIGAIQAFYEGSMFTFVFVWVPTVLKAAPTTHLDLLNGSIVENSSPPLGLVFASFMV